MMVLIMIDELGDEVEVGRFNLQLDLDSDELDIWKDRKVAEAREHYPEAQGFYWEDRRGWDMLIAGMLHQMF